MFVASLCVTAIGSRANNGVRKGAARSSERKQCKSEAHQNRTVIVDAGANCGNSLKRLQQLFPRLRAPSVEVYLWEANPHVQRAYLGDIEMRDPRVKLYRNAVWIRNEPVTFFLQKRDENKTVDELRHEFPCKPWDRHGNAHGGSSLISDSIENGALYKKGANAFNRGVGVHVQGRDFPAWLVSLKLCKERDRDYVIDHRTQRQMPPRQPSPPPAHPPLPHTASAVRHAAHAAEPVSVLLLLTAPAALRPTTASI